MPEHVHYLEPFFGSGAVFFCKQPSKFETINDLDSDVTNLFRVIRTRKDELAAAVEMTPWSREEYDASFTHAGDELEDARRFLVRCWQSFGAKFNDETGWAHSISSRGRYCTQNWRALPKRIAVVADRLLHAQIENQPGVKVIKRYSNPEVLIYCDPPYVQKIRGDRWSGEMYSAELTDADHAELLDVLDAHPGPVILSGYACPLYDDRLKHWTRLTHDATAERGKKRTEILWMNPECVRRQGRLFD
jgi:DNA adenine methylase